jgi:hypothetical protein
MFRGVSQFTTEVNWRSKSMESKAMDMIEMFSLNFINHAFIFSEACRFNQEVNRWESEINNDLSSLSYESEFHVCWCPNSTEGL